jgi:hypothetical protein
MLRLTYVAAFRSGAARARPLNYAACLSRRADTISIASLNPTLDLLFANHDSPPGCILHLGALFVELVRVARAFAVVCHYSGSHLAAIAARCWAI